AVIVLRSRESESAIHNLVTRFLAESNALLLRFVVASPGRKPHARSGSVFRSRFANGGESIGKPGIETPDGIVVVPSVVKQERIESHTTLDVQFLAEGVNAIQSIGL